MIEMVVLASKKKKKNKLIYSTVQGIDCFLFNFRFDLQVNQEKRVVSTCSCTRKQEYSEHACMLPAVTSPQKHHNSVGMIQSHRHTTKQNLVV